jgi:putative endonuclease
MLKGEAEWSPRGMTKGTSELGKKGEKIARKYLRRQGYRIRALNYSCPSGEIDIIAQDGKTISFVEVRTLSSGKYGPPFETLTFRKRRNATRTALHYLHRFNLADRDWRFDFVGIVLPENSAPEIELVKDAFRPAR